jgi:RNA polymerase sigma factor (sigma-70 family)
MRCPGGVWFNQDEVVHLVRAAQRGEPRALDALLARLRPGFVTFFARRLGSDAAEDAAQAALIRIAGAFRRIDPERAGPYIITVAENLLRSECRRHAREAGRSAPVELADTLEAPGTPEGEADFGDFDRTVRQASLGTLPPELRDIILGLLRGLSPSEIAAEHHVHPVTIRTRLLRARVLLRPALRCYRSPDSRGT